MNNSTKMDDKMRNLYKVGLLLVLILSLLVSACDFSPSGDTPDNRSETRGEINIQR